ncbi:RNA-directed DNA polymerase from mobile element jockey-like protein [Leptotrombidium deliense]|uniref:RNA-directed DNA polymerase from mobile element jockey-like protein n=1 Tax=Leptotrombidium deliense TaxID=299467 RepID=A0A443RSY3_9ACAR|nr:RNA-directed DNA polymerase from mobile element jockey-like protein [Leptotrombidium deliense]
MFKIVGELILNRISQPLEIISYFKHSQHGFRKNKSTSTAQITLLHRLRTDLDNKKFCALILIDAAKAFDLVDHQLLLKLLIHIGFSGKLVKLMKSYLANRFIECDDGTLIACPPFGSLRALKLVQNFLLRFLKLLTYICWFFTPSVIHSLTDLQHQYKKII